MSGQLSNHPLAELICEVSAAGLSGALRLEQDRAKVVIYFNRGDLYYASSNLRVHRLAEVLKRARFISESQLSDVQDVGSDQELGEALLRRGFINAETLDHARTDQVGRITRAALLWTNGNWVFDRRARVAEEVHITLDLTQLLMECARHLPSDYVASRLMETNPVFTRPAVEQNGARLQPVEAFVLSRVEGPITLAELTAVSGVPEDEALRTIYALALGGLLGHSNWSAGVARDTAKKTVATAPAEKARAATASSAEDDADETALQELFDRLSRARDHYEVLDLGRGVSGKDVKNAYHMLARRFHPDRFHQSDAGLRARVESAFARIAQAYEVLSDASLRAAYEAKLKTRTGPESRRSPGAKADEKRTPSAEQAEAAFRKGSSALKQQQQDAAIASLAEAAHLAPQVARYRAAYGQALSGLRNSRRAAEIEFQAALSVEPENASYRIMLAELYLSLGLKKRAQTELERALMSQPNNKEAQALLAGIRK